MRAIVLLGALVLAACNPTGPVAHTEAQWQVCERGTFTPERISACSAVAADPNADARRRATALVQRGMLRREYGEQTRAVADFGRALRLDNTYADAYVERGLVHHERGAFEVAVRDFDAALAIDPNIPLAIERRQAALSGRVDAFRAELERLDAAIARDPINAAFLNNRCWLRATNDDNLDIALADCSAALRISPRNVNALDSRGLVHLKRGEFAEALADYEAALAIEPDTGHYLYGRGLARRGLGQVAEGDADLAAGERAQPGVTALYGSYGRIL